MSQNLADKLHAVLFAVARLLEFLVVGVAEICNNVILCAGKTTLLRDMSQVLADKLHKVLIVVDTSQEIAGGGDTPHSCIGNARRMAGTEKQSKHEALQEAVTNHGPEVWVYASASTALCLAHLINVLNAMSSVEAAALHALAQFAVNTWSVNLTMSFPPPFRSLYSSVLLQCAQICLLLLHKL